MLKRASLEGYLSTVERSDNGSSYYDLAAMQHILLPATRSKLDLLREAVRRGQLSLVPDETVVTVLLNELCTPHDDMDRVAQ